MAESGRRIARHYELGAQLGAGRAGRVFAARDLRTGSDVAVKLRDSDDDSPLDVESAGLRQLEHPNLLRILDAGSDGGRRFIVTELVREGALDALPKPLAPESLHALASQMLDALAFLHAHGILHGDIKTENVLVAGLAPPHFKLSDFGLAQRRVDLAAGTTRGSPAFMPPEIIRGEPADERSDLYALGITLYECAFGELPFDDADVRTVLMRHLTEVPVRLQDPGDVDPQLVRLLRRLLAKEPAQRPTDARAALALWRGDAAAAPRWVPPRLGVLIGRDAELATLEEAFAGETAAIGIEGPSGLGKTRLLRELALRMELRGVRVATWTPQGLFGIESELDSTFSSEPMQTEETDPRPLTESREQSVLLQLGNSPWLLLIDDIDNLPTWFADAASSLIREVASGETSNRLICVAGQEHGTRLVHDALEAGGFAAAAGIILEPWHRASLESAASALFGVRRLHPDLVGLLEGATAGIPAEVEAACQQLAAKSLLRLDTQGALTPAAETTPQNFLDPRSARAAAQLKECSPQELLLLQTLAILQAPAPTLLLETLDPALTQVAMRLHRRGLTTVHQRASTTRVVLAYEGIRTAALEILPSQDRRRHHDRIADALEREPSVSPEEIAALHRAAGSDLAAARDAVGRLSSTSEAELRPELLNSAYSSLLELWPASDDPAGRLETVLAYLDTKLRLGLYEETRDYVSQLIDKTPLEEFGQQAIRNREAQALFYLGQSEQASILLHDDSAGRAGIESRVLRAQILSDWGQHEEVLRVCDSVPLPELADSMAATIIDLRSSSLSALGRAGNATELLGEWIPRLEARDAIRSVATLLLRLSYIEFYQGKMRDAEGTMDRALTTCRSVGDRRGMVRALNNLAAVYAETGRYEDASEQLRSALELCRRLGDSDSLNRVLGNLAQLLLLQARYREALDRADESIAIGMRRNLVTSTVQGRIGRGGILAALGLDDQCHAELAPILEEVKGQALEGQILLLWIDLALRRSETALAAPWLERARQVLIAAEADDELVQVDLQQSRLWWLDGARDRAIEVAKSTSSRARQLNLFVRAVEADALQAEFSIESRPEQALEIARVALDAAVTIGVPESIWRLHRIVGRIALVSGDYPAALAAYQACVQSIQGICENVPTAYLDSYLEHPDRIRVFEESGRLGQSVRG